MKKHIIVGGLGCLMLAIATQAYAAPQPITISPSKVEPIKVQIPTSTDDSSSIKLPNLVVDPSLKVVDPTVKTPTPLPIDPGILQTLQPIPIPPLVIPPELLKGPEIKDIQMATNGNLLRIQWSTDRTADTIVDFGPSSSYGQTVTDKNLVQAHDVLIAVKPGTLHVRLSSTDALNRLSKTQDIVVAVPEALSAPAEDTTTGVSAAQATPTGSTAPPTNQIQPTERANEQPTLPPQASDASSDTPLLLVMGLIILALLIVIIVFLVRRPKQPQSPSSEK